MYIIGDLHANVGELKKLMSLLEIKAGDKIIFLGDLIDKNIETKKTIDLLNEISSKHDCVFIKGDHEFVWERYLMHNDIARQDFILNYGGVAALQKFTDDPKDLVINNKIVEIKSFLQPYLDLIQISQDFYLLDEYLIMHAGLLESQLDQEKISIDEENYFLREDKMNFDKKYLGKYKIIAGHTYFSKEPFIKPGYINIDLGAGSDGFLGAFDTKNKKVIRSDSKIFSI